MKDQPRRNNTKDSHNTGKLHAQLLFRENSEVCTYILNILLLEQIQWSQHLFLSISSFCYCLQRNTVLKALKGFPVSGKLVENSPFSWCDEHDIGCMNVFDWLIIQLTSIQDRRFPMIGQ